MTTLDAKGLAPCPFCGGEAERITLEDEENFGGDVICCTKCQASSHVEFGFKENLVAAWNRRAPAQSINAEMLEALKAILFEDSDKPEIDRIADRTRAAAIIDRAEAATDAGGDA